MCYLSHPLPTIRARICVFNHRPRACGCAMSPILRSAQYDGQVRLVLKLRAKVCFGALANDCYFADFSLVSIDTDQIHVTSITSNLFTTPAGEFAIDSREKSSKNKSHRAFHCRPALGLTTTAHARPRTCVAAAAARASSCARRRRRGELSTRTATSYNAGAQNRARCARRLE